MVWLKRVLVQGLAGLLLIGLLGGAYSISLNRTLGNPDTVESSLRNSRAYDQIASYAITRATESTSTPSGTVSLNDPKVKAIAQSVFSKQLIQQNAETFINGNYRWLDGETQTPAFTIDVSAAKLKFATEVNQTVLDYLSKLPICTQAQLTQMLSSTVDPLTIACRPAPVVPKAEADRVTDQIMSSDFLSQPVVTANTLKIGGQTNQDKPYYERFAKAPQAYQLAQKLPFIFGTLAILAAIGIIVIASRRKGIRRVGLTFVFAGLLLIATKFASDSLFNRFQAKVFAGNTDATDVQKPLTEAARQLEKQMVATDLYIGIAFIIIGVILAVVYYRTRPQSSENRMATPTPSAPIIPITKPGGIQLARPPKGPAVDIATRPSRPTTPSGTPSPVAPRAPKPRPHGRLVQ